MSSFLARRAARGAAQTIGTASNARRITLPQYRALATTPTNGPAANGNGNGHSRNSRWGRFLQTLGRATLVTVLGATGAVVYLARQDRHPGAQLPHDPSRKTIVVVGSGWGATSFLKSLDTDEYNVVVVSPHNYFLFTPLLPSCAVGTVSLRSIIQPTRYVTRHKKRAVSVIEAEAKEVDPVNKTITFHDTSAIKGEVVSTTMPYDYLVYAVGAETQTFGIPGVKEYGCFMKELHDANTFREQMMDCIETAAFPGQSDKEIDRLLHMVVVGGGPTGIELSGELHDFLVEDLKYWYPELADRLRITLIEALPTVLPMFSKQLISYTESTFKTNKIEILTKTMVKEVKPNAVIVQKEDKSVVEIPMGLLVWAGGNKGRQITVDLMKSIGSLQAGKRGLQVDDHLSVRGAEGSIWALGDCTQTSYAPTAQVASQQGAYLAKLFSQMAKREELEKNLQVLRAAGEDAGEDAKKVEGALQRHGTFAPFHYSHQGSLAYIGSDKAISDLPFWGGGNLATGGLMTFWFWRSAYLSTLYSLRNRTLVGADWLATKIFGRDVSRE
ncbi:NADH dehydrogenase [Auriculariales sp. MPI-PUGE-AT-0066]|nr:NADH dehydrogenase [Auriculariales sp. MPI-PUGE-AT-0066]